LVVRHYPTPASHKSQKKFKPKMKKIFFQNPCHTEIKQAASPPNHTEIKIPYTIPKSKFHIPYRNQKQKPYRNQNSIPKPKFHTETKQAASPPKIYFKKNSKIILK
jgi:hypothetical protein